MTVDRDGNGIGVPWWNSQEPEEGQDTLAEDEVVDY